MTTERAPIRFHELVGKGIAAAGGDAAAISDGNTTVSYSELAERTRAVASALHGLVGIEPGDRVAIYLEKRIEAVVAMQAVSAAGAIFVPINPALKQRQVAHILIDSGARLLITSGQRHRGLAQVLSRSGLEAVVLVDGADASSNGASPQVLTWSALGQARSTARIETKATETDPAAIFYTSGSTGPPKGVVVSHRNLIAGAESVAGYLGNGPSDRILALLPLSFDAGFSQLSTAFASGAEAILLDYLLPGDVARVCAERRVTGLTCVPPLWVQLAGLDWPAQAAESLRYFASTGGRMPPATLTRLRETFPHALPFLMYGLTEAFRSTFLDPDEIDNRPGSIGKAVPNAEVLVLRPDGSECEPGEVGELVHRGALVSLGYWNDPERTAERFRPIPGRGPQTGVVEYAVWSGDAVTRDEDGFLYFVERIDETIKTSGYRVSPTEIEDAAYATDLVGEAVAIGLPDEARGETIALAVRAAGDDGGLEPGQLLAALRRELPRFMLPSRIETLASLPRSPNGKFDRGRIRQMLMEGTSA